MTIAPVLLTTALRYSMFSSYKSRNGLVVCVTAFLISMLTMPVVSQEIIEIRPISFGTVVVLDNTTVGSINIDAIGNVNISTHFAVIEPPLYGEFQLIDYPVNANLFLSGGILQGQTTTPTFSPEQFTLAAVNVPGIVNIGSDGTALIRAGGRMETSGSASLNFGDTTYTSRLIITVNF